MSFKPYAFSEQNQPLWEKFESLRRSEIESKQIAKGGSVNKSSTDINISQYREIVALLDSLCSDFNQLTPEIINRAKIAKPGKATHLNGFLLVCVGQSWLTVSNDVILDMLPVDYRLVVEKMA